jgi:hypothetical protein
MIKRIALMFAATTALMLTVVAGFKPYTGTPSGTS